MDEIKVSVVEFGDRAHYQMQYRDPMTGRKKTRSTGVERTGRKKDREAAAREAGKWEDELRTGRYHAPGKITWADFRQRYEDEKLASLAVGTGERAAAVFNHIEDIVSPRRLVDLTADRLSYFQSKLRETGLKEPTIAGILAHLRAALSWAKSMKMIHTLPEIAMPKRAKGKQMRGRPITLEEFERMLAAVPAIRPEHADQWKRFLWGLWLSGLRLSEALQLSWDQDAAIMVDLSGKHPRLRIWAEAEKGHQDRLLPIPPDFAQWLTKTEKADRHGAVFSLPGTWADENMSIKRISRVISAIGEKANVLVNKADGKFASAHDLRRAFATRWAPKVKPSTLQLMMRHESIETTLKYYVAQATDDISAELWGLAGNSLSNTVPADAAGQAGEQSATTNATSS